MGNVWLGHFWTVVRRMASRVAQWELFVRKGPREADVTHLQEGQSPAAARYEATARCMCVSNVRSSPVGLLRASSFIQAVL